MQELEQPAQIGQLIADRYHVEEVLGRGGMATVYRVRDARRAAVVALKRGWARDGKKLQQRGALLEREYHTLAQLAHPSIIEVYEYGFDAQGPYYTMELLGGGDLVNDKRAPWKQVCELLCDVASSLAIIHSRGLIHRDVSLRNVRRAADGRAKLIDFGAMVSMGVAKEVVGTPPFMAPEVLQMQELDARADLFSLGAIGYYMLTGRHAYPARRFIELRDVWRSRLVAPARLVPDLPPALNALIAQLLMLDRNARPQSAAEVMERLCAIAGLPMQEGVDVSRAYLRSPILVGREKALIGVRRRMLSLVRGDGGTLLIDGVAGSGRSRMLDATVLEGKLLGATVVRADAADGARGDWGVARTLGNQLFQLLPDEAAEAARLSRDVIGHVLENLRTEQTASGSMPERSLLLRELRDFVLSLASGQRLLLVVDDVDKIDEPSAALLAALAHKTERHALMLALAVDRDGARSASASLRLLSLIADPIELEPLEPEQTEALMRSVFGDVANVRLIAGRIHAASRGSPRSAMELAQHLVDRGRARYQAGSWSLPSQLADDDLPSTLADSLGRRLESLSPEARALADALCLADADMLVLDQLPGLADGGSAKQVFGALDELVAARVLVADGEHYTFAQRGFLSVLDERMPKPRKLAIHGRIADLLARSGGDPVRRAHHLLRGAREPEAIALLCSMNLQARLPPVGLLEEAAACAENAGMSARVLHQLRMAILSSSSLVLAADSFQRALPPVLDQLEADSGLRAYHEHPELPPGERLSHALAQAQAHYLGAEEHARVYPPVDAIRELARLSGAFCSFAMQLLDLKALEALPVLAPFEPLSPSLALVEALKGASCRWLEGRYLDAKTRYEHMLEQMERQDHAGLDEAQLERTRLGLHFLLGLLDGGFGIAKAEEHATMLERDPAYRVNAWRIRMLLHMARGNTAEARKCQRRAELAQLQDAGEQRYLGMGASFELAACANAGDLLGVKSLLDTVRGFAERYPFWRPWAAYGQARYRWLQGDLSGALEALVPGLERAQPGRHNAWSAIAGTHVALLNELGLTAEAIAQGRRYFAVHKELALLAPDHGIAIALSKALARGGQTAEAVQIIEGVIARAEGLGSEGLALGLLYEARARIAILMNDHPGFEQASERCANEYRKAHNPVLSASFARLLDDARQHELGPVELAPVQDLLDVSQTEMAEENTLHSRMLECNDEGERWRCALTLLLQSTESCVGYLYAVKDRGVAPLAGLPDVPPETGLSEWIGARVRLEVESQAGATATQESDEEVLLVPDRYTDLEGRSFESLLLVSSPDEGARLAAVLALQITPGPRTLPSRALCAMLANELLVDGDGIALDS